MIDILKREDLRAVAERQEGTCVSLYMPAVTPEKAQETKQNPVRYGHLLAGAEEELVKRGMRAPDARDYLAPAYGLLEPDFYWDRQGDGFAAFLSAETFRHWRLPVRFEERVVVSDGRFYIKPLLPVFGGDGRFFVLAVSQDSVRFFQGTHYTVAELDPKGVSPSLHEALKYDDPEKSLQFHTGAPPAGGGKRAAMFHGDAEWIDRHKDELLRYFHILNKGLHELLKEENVPLVFAGVEYLFPIYQEANTYLNLVEKPAATGSPELVSAEEIHREAWPLVRPRFEEGRREAAAKYRETIGTGLASGDPSVVVPAAVEGRVESLFAARGAEAWGAYDGRLHKAHLHERREPGSTDLTDLAAVETLLHGGAVYVVEAGEMPGPPPLAAVFRY
jgi:hypothetical protein